MEDKNKTRKQLMDEPAGLRQRITVLEASETEHNQAEKMPPLPEEYVRLFELFPIGITLLDMKGVILFCNSAVYNNSGYTKDEFTGKHFSEIASVRVKDIPAYIRVFNSIVRGKIPKPFGAIYQRKDGTTGWTELNISLIKVSGKRRILVIQHDITQREKAQAALRKSEERYRSTLDSMMEGCQIIDYDWRYLYVNDAVARHGRTTRKQLLGKTLMECYPGIEKTEMFAVLRRCMKERTSHRIQNEFTFPDGSKGWFELSIQPAPEGIFILSEDITERKRMEEALEESKRFFSGTLDNLLTFIGVLEPNGKVIFVNNTPLDAAGLKQEDVVEKMFYDTYWWAHSEEARQTIKKNIERCASGESLVHDIEAQMAGGLRMWVEYSMHPIYGEEGEIEYLVAEGRDITERKRAEEALHQSEKKYRDLVENLNDIVYAVDENGVITYVSPIAESLSGYSPSELIGRSFTEFVYQEDLPLIMESFQRVVSGHTEYPEHRFLTKSGEVRWVRTSSRPIFMENRVIGLQGVLTDITEHKRVEEEKMKWEREAQAASRLASIGEMASGIAHEINNPLVGVIGFAELLSRKDIPEDIRKYVDNIHIGARRVAGIVGGLLTFARQQKPERTYVNINDILESTLSLRTYSLETNNIKVVKQFAPSLPKTIADAGQLQQVFLNIIINAETEMRLAHSKGELIIKTERLDNTIRISFKDDGPGIAKENLQRIFDPFFTTRGVGRGTGLGLSVCHGIITELGGKIYAESELGQGATLFVELPILMQDEHVLPTRAVTEEIRKTAKAHILVVDDELAVRELLSEALIEEGYTVEAADNASNALGKLKTTKYDLILLDIKLPGMSGVDLYERIQATTPPPARRVVIITGDVMGGETKDFLTKTNLPFITKPFDTESLKETINRMLTDGVQQG